MEEDSVKSLVKLVLKSSSSNPYKGILSDKDTLLGAIEVAKKGKEFADKGDADEAMHYDSATWEMVISELESKLKSA